MRLIAVFVIDMALMLVVAGCGAISSNEFATRIVGSNGQTIVLDNVESIVSDPGLSDEEKRSQLRALGLEDEKLIEALLGL